MITKKNTIVVLKADSSSLKFAVYDVRGAHLGLVARGRIDGFGKAARFEAEDIDGVTLANWALPAGPEAFTHADAFKVLAGWLRRQYGEHTMVTAVGHYIAHGGEDFAESTLINAEVLEILDKLVPLSPVDLPHNIAGVRAVSQLCPDLPQVACFDTAFHWARSRVSTSYALSNDWFDQGVRRWGYQGLACESVVSQFGDVMPQSASGRIIVAHLGNVASLCAMNGGRSADSTMGFSTLEGLPMGTRCGSIDPGVVFYLLGRMTQEQVEEHLYNKSGLQGMSGISSEMRVLLASDDPRAEEAVTYFVYRVMREIGSLVAALEGLDALVFTAGIGENSPEIRWRVCKGLAWLGVALDRDANDRGHGCISQPGHSPSVWVIPSDEEGLIAAHTKNIVSMLPARIGEQRGGRDAREAVGQ